MTLARGNAWEWRPFKGIGRRVSKGEMCSREITKKEGGREKKKAMRPCFKHDARRRDMP